MLNSISILLRFSLTNPLCNYGIHNYLLITTLMGQNQAKIFSCYKENIIDHPYSPFSERRFLQYGGI